MTDQPPSGREATENRRIARAAGVVGLLTLLSRIAGLLRDAVVGYYFGTGAAADSFFVAFRLPNLLRRFVAEGATNVAFIPVLSDYLANRKPEETSVAVRALLTITGAAVAVLTAAGIVLAPQLTWLFAPGFVADAAKFHLTVTLTRLVFPYLLLIALAALLGGLLNANRHFIAPAMSPVFLNVAIIAAAVLLSPRLGQPVYALALGVVLGGVAQLALQVVPLAKRRVVLSPLWRPRHPAVRRVAWLMAPTLFGAAVYQINVMVGTIMASVLPGGSVSYLWYADRVFEFPLGVFAAALGTAALPSFSTQAARHAYAELRDSVSFAFRLTNIVAVPATVGILCLAVPITAVLFQRGAFGFREVEQTAWALSTFAVGLWPVSIVRVLVPAFYALNDTRTPVIAATIAFAANCCASIMFMGPVPATGGSVIADGIALLTAAFTVTDLRHAGLALATSVASTANVLVLFAVLRRRLGSLAVRPLAISLARSIVASLAMVWPVQWTASWVDWSLPGGLAVKGAVLLSAVGVGMAVFGVVVVVLGGEDVRRLLQVIRRRVTGR